MRALLRAAPLLASALFAACGGSQPPQRAAPSAPAEEAAVVRRPIEVPVPPQSAPTTPAQAASAAPRAFPPDALYVCVSERAGQRTETVIEFSPKVLALCTRHPEMGPCQYERDLCRKGGGRVFAAGGKEITRQTEDDYDRKVMRARFRAN